MRDVAQWGDMESTQRKLEGRTALITGASRGLGRAMAVSLSRAGARVALAGRDRAALLETAQSCGGAPGRVHTFQAELTREAEVDGLHREVMGTLGGIDILINNAGINIRKPITDFTAEEWHRVLDTNLTSAFLMCRAFIPQMKERKYGRIINITSMMSHISIPNRTAYSASKAGLLGLTKALALELAPFGITANGISPGPIATELNAPILQNPELNQQFIAKIPLGRWGQPHEIGELAVYLSSADAGFITGTDILIDGGWSAQ